MTKAIKGFNKDWTCRDFQFAPGGTYETPGPVKACENGFHAIEGHPFEVFGYYPPGTSRYAEVTLGGDMAREDGGDSKVAAQRIKIGAEILLGDLVSRAVEYVVSRAKMARGSAAKADGAAAQASGTQGAAQASGNRGAAQASGTQGAAQASGPYGASQALGEASTALASGCGGKVSGKVGCALFLVYRNPSTGTILHAWAGIVGRDGIKPDTFYTLNRDGQPVPTT